MGYKPTCPAQVVSERDAHREIRQGAPTPGQEMNSRNNFPNLWCPDRLKLPHFSLGGKVAVVHGQKLCSHSETKSTCD